MAVQGQVRFPCCLPNVGKDDPDRRPKIYTLVGYTFPYSRLNDALIVIAKVCRMKIKLRKNSHRDT